MLHPPTTRRTRRCGSQKKDREMVPGSKGGATRPPNPGWLEGIAILEAGSVQGCPRRMIAIASSEWPHSFQHQSFPISLVRGKGH